MEDFRKEVKEISTEDLLLIIEDQEDLYSKEEFKILKEELASRPNNAIELEAEVAEQQERIRREEALLKEKERIAENKRKRFEAKINALKDNGYDGYYEYTTISLNDNSDGRLSVDQVTRMLNEYALNGWRLVSAYANEIGRNTSSSGFGGYSSGTNSTIDQNILILERFIKI